MAAEAPNPRTLATWEDGFQHPIPVTRKLEQQLRANADENREKLRSLVGASYRNLLDTAETIVDMEASMEQVEATLTKAGRNCNSRTVERITGNAGRMDGAIRADTERYTFAAQLAVLRSCPTVMGRLLKADGSHLLVAKVLVLSRLLHKALSQSSGTPPLVQHLWDRVLSMRRKLLRRIDRRLASPTSTAVVLVETMCAYALATSSTPTQLLRHFHKARLDKVVGLLHSHEELAKHGSTALRLCIQTCQDTQTIFPRRLAESLAKLKAQPLVKDADVRALYELNLDIHDRWLGDEARNYTHWTRHDELQKPEAERILHLWSKQAITAFLGGTKTALEHEHRLEEVASLRQELIETWILSGSRMAGIKSANMLDDLRDTMNTHLENTVRSRTQSLKKIVSTLLDMLNSPPSSANPSGRSLWGAVSKITHLSNGAAAFKTTILNTQQGRDDSVISIISLFDAWMNSVLQVKSIVKSMKDARWDDTFADDVEDLDDDDFGESRQTLLSDDDPRLLEEVTHEAINESLQNLGTAFAQIVEGLTKEGQDKEIQKICFVLRVMREISEKIPALRLQDKATPLATPFTLDLLRPLHTSLAKQVVQPATSKYTESLATASMAKSNSHVLWEGNPALPTQPSPSAFGYLQALTKTMAALGSDLWAPACVSVLKAIACDHVSEILRSHLDSVMKSDDKQDKGEEEDEKLADPTTAADQITQQKLKQALFDALYIQRFVGNIKHGDALADLLKGTNGKSDLDEGSIGRLRKSAADYAKKTYLLFALLA